MRIALKLEYDGSRYAGWQYQSHSPSVQEAVERALAFVAAAPVRVVAAGRTDAGVHAWEQIVHFDTEAVRPERAWVQGTNTRLADDIRVLWARPVPCDFHAQRQALARWYRYRICNRPVAPALGRTQLSWCHRPLDEGKMQQAAERLLGEHDFSSFRGPYCQSKSPYRRVYLLEVSRCGDEVAIDIVANAFLHNMVRNIAGVLMAVGSGKRPVDWVSEVLAARDRRAGGVTAPPHGLYFAGIWYPQKFGLPRQPIFARLPQDIRRVEAYD
ncbi:tRNA pseudouridine38-40 synthase [Methylomarinovum tepidoasis]|uniref:tRNA pseudouridine synthase A n=1 Tax=Methylomarinovum tepidoasis TaxID=2840183 RepID=A0AAU9CKJ5_9GAMM|nr:tRNA pseudouridine(38-40) synthase TruA [Methylomarinovum sp. IN45]BCX89961.1 tRNA pseudouridine38-40 synthase [Methylomarinovum sp. IN45]